MTTSWTSADIAALEAAIKGGVLRVRFADREVQYHSMSEMLKLLSTMKEMVATAASGRRSRTSYASFRKGPGSAGRDDD
jgi:hypothetical protein